MRLYQPIFWINKTKKWDNFDVDYFTSLKKGKEYIENNFSHFLSKDCGRMGLDVYDEIKGDYIGMFWEYNPPNHWIRSYE